LGPHQGARVAQYQAHKLERRGQFLLDGQRYQAIHAGAEMRTLLATLPLAPDAATWLPAAVEAPEPSPDEPTGPKWQAFFDGWIAVHPEHVTANTGASDLARAMAAEESNVKPYTDYKSIAQAHLEAFRSAVRLPGNIKLGTDITHGSTP
jgi:hypothetical protein